MKSSVVAALMGASGSTRVYAAPDEYTGRLFVAFQAEGAWDVTSFCDPKMNVAGEPEINWWARTGETQTAGNISYAPFAKNEEFFQKYYSDMLVVNGIDTQTNSHTVGVIHSWSGRTAIGYPSLPALFSAQSAPDIPLSYMNFGGYGETANLIRSSKLSEIDALTRILKPNTVAWAENSTYKRSDILELISAARGERLERMASNSLILPREAFNIAAYKEALESSPALERFASVLPADDDVQPLVNLQGYDRTILQQVQMAVLAFKSGVASSADLFLPGFDTHTDHDQDHEPLMGLLTDAIDYLWTYAEEQGVADRLTVMISSDFGRTPFYNASLGKDHWPITSAIFMEKNASWGNRVIGVTDEGHNALEIDASSLTQNQEGTLIYPIHIHKAVRNYLGINSDDVFPFFDTENLDIFS